MIIEVKSLLDFRCLFFPLQNWRLVTYELLPINQVILAVDFVFNKI